MHLLKDEVFQLVEPRGEDENGEELFVLHQQVRALKDFDMVAQFQEWKRTADSRSYLDTAGRLKPGHGSETVRWAFLSWLERSKLISYPPETTVTLISIDPYKGPMPQPAF